MEQTPEFNRWMQVFSDDQDELLDFYYEACESVPRWLETNHNDIRRFREELAAHIRDSSEPAHGSETQWTTDEILRDLWFDVLGAEPPPDDPYPVPRERWGRHRTTKYMRDIPTKDTSRVPEKTRRWLTARNIAFEDLAAYREPGAERDHTRPEPPGFRERLAELTAAGHRSGPVEGEHAAEARADLLDAKQSYLETGHAEQAAGIDKILADREPRDE